VREISGLRCDESSRTRAVKIARCSIPAGEEDLYSPLLRQSQLKALFSQAKGRCGSKLFNQPCGQSRLSLNDPSVGDADLLIEEPCVQAQEDLTCGDRRARKPGL
jgi:hypothetical protein